MADTVTKVDYYTVAVAHKPGAAASVLGAIAEQGVNLVGFWGYPMGPETGNLEIVPEDSGALRKAAKKAKIELGEKRVAFLVHGKNKPGAVGRVLAKIGAAGINVHAAQAVAGAGNKYGAVIYVMPDDVKATAKALGA